MIKVQITRQSEYAIKMVLELSIHYGENVSAKTISRRQDIPEFFLKKTTQVLARAGIVQSQRGAKGGVKLLIPPEKITIADVIEAIEGKIALNVCLANGYECPNKNFCRVRNILSRAQEGLMKELRKDTFADLLKKVSGLDIDTNY